jgi:hypothetical protein
MKPGYFEAKSNSSLVAAMWSALDDHAPDLTCIHALVFVKPRATAIWRELFKISTADPRYIFQVPIAAEPGEPIASMGLENFNNQGLHLR